MMNPPRLPRLRFFGGLSPEDSRAFAIQLLALYVLCALLYLTLPDSVVWWQAIQRYQAGNLAAGRAELCWVIWLAVSPLLFALVRSQSFERVRVRDNARRVLTGCALVYLLVVHVRLGVLSLIHLSSVSWQGEDFWPGAYRDNLVGLLPQDLLTFGGLLAVALAMEFSLRLRAKTEDTRLLNVRALQLESDLARAELATLRNQLHPHFLFNSFNAIATLVRQQKNQQAVEVIAQLSTLLRLAIDRSGLNEVPLQRELDFVRCYLGLEQVRFGEKLSVEFAIEPVTVDAMVPNIVLQPLVENAVKHGISNRTSPGVIRLSTRRAADRLRIEIANDGPDSPVSRKAGEPGIGLVNARAQLDRLYGADYWLALAPQPAGGMTVSLDLPWRTTLPLS